MKTILFILLFILGISGFAQENPWGTNLNITENPWLSEEEKTKIIEEERAKAAEEARIKMEILKMNDSISRTNRPKDSLVSVAKIDATARLAELRAEGTNIYQLGYNQAEKRFHANGMGALGFFITLVPLIGNPIVWIMAGSYPSDYDLTKNHEKNKEFLNDDEYYNGYKKSARKIRAGRLMIGNLFGNITKLIIFLSLIN
jgi:hypothetical protein